ncbi:MAG: hydrogenase maturation nickel metallochaperone HypA [Planctomycetes bacterium]|nr:hydrogenase maturation nickel metallochaperone HypA [Planctomycetota bacterium]
MHEMSIAVDMMQQLERIAAEHGVSRVERIELEVGVLRLVVPEALRDAFSAVAAGTVAEGAELDMVETPARARCGACGEEYPVQVEEYLCPRCGQAAGQILAGNDIIIRSLVCDSDGGGAAHEDQGG